MSGPDESTIDVVRTATRKLARSFDYAYWREKDKLGEYPWEFVKAFAQGGWLGALIPDQYGGLGLGIAESGVMMQEIAASGAGASGASAVHFYLFPPEPIIRHGSAAMKQEFLPKLARGEILMAFGVTEPTAGVDTSRIRTKAEKVDGGWVVNGQKVWISNAQNAHKILLLARTSPRNEDKPLDGMTLFFTDLDRERITVREIEKLGRSAIDSNELFIENLEVCDDDVVGEVGRGFRYLVDGLNSERIVVGLEGVGIGQAALELATKYANDRVVFDRPIGQNQAVAHPLADSWIRLESARLMAMHAVMGMDTMAAYAAAKERVLGRARDAGMVRQDLTADDMAAVVWMALAIVHKTGRDTAVNRRYLTLLFDGLRPTGQRLPAARSESPSGSANREPRRSHKRPCSVGRPDTPRP